MTWLNYLVLVNVYLFLFYGFYVLLLRNETFFQLNRIYLVAASLLSFFIPLIQSNWVRDLFITQRVQYSIYSSPVMFYQFQPIQHTQVTVGQVSLFVYLAGVFILMGRFTWQLIRLKKIFNTPTPGAAYSFFNKIRLGDDLADSKVITEHEKAHAGQWHSVDILMIETVMIINWFNPVVYLYRSAIRHIHEFIADRQALKTGTDKKNYALLLLSQAFNAPVHQLVNPFFNHSLLKQRIMMMQKNRSQKVKLVKYGLSAPLFILMLILSSATVNNSATVKLFNNKVSKVFLMPAVTNTSAKAVNLIYATKTRGKVTDIQLTQLNTIADTTPKKGGNEIFTSVEQVPMFDGGLKAFGDFLNKNIKYPKESRDKNIQGRVIISFIVEQNGELSNIKVVRGVDAAIDAEALRVMSLSPKWTPGIQNGRLVRVAYSVPISFTLSNDNLGKPAGMKTGAVNLRNDSIRKLTLASTIFYKKSDSSKKLSSVDISEMKTNPLFMLNGKEVDNITNLNPDKIESISVLKAESATSIYGAKAINGVVVIITKKGSVKPSVIKLKPVKPASN